MSDIVESVGSSGIHYNHPDCRITKWHAEGSPQFGSMSIGCTCPPKMGIEPADHPAVAAAVAEWHKAQLEEALFWGDCSNTYTEETKQILYMRKMGFQCITTGRSAHAFDGAGRSFVDFGGGPTSVLLKFTNALERVVVDPAPLPPWVKDRYETAGVRLIQLAAEDIADQPKVGWLTEPSDVGLLYNCLQHTRDPEKVVRNLMAVAREVKIFEWIDIPPHPGHPHQIRAEDLERWTGRVGEVDEFFGLNDCFGRAWFLR